MFATFGSIEFEVLTSPTSFRARQGYTYAEHKVVEDVPRLQWLSNDLEEISLRCYWHVQFTNPQTQFDALRRLAAAHRAELLTFGNGLVRGYFVVTEIGEDIENTADDGSLISIECEITLKQYAQTSGVVVSAEPPPGVSPTAPAQPGVSAISASPAPVTSTGDFNTVAPPNAARAGGAGGNF